MNKKHLFLTLALAGVAAFSVGAFAGCGNGNPDDSENNPPITDGENENPDDSGNNPSQDTTPVDHGTVTSSGVEKTATVTDWTEGVSDDIKVIYANEGAMMMVNYTKYTLTLNDDGYTISQQKAKATILDEGATDTGDDIYVIGESLPSAIAPGPNSASTDALDGRKVKVEFSEDADAADDQGNLLNVNYEGSYWVQNGDYVLLSAISLTEESANAGAKITSDTFVSATTAGMVVKLSSGGKFEIVDLDVSYVTAEADKNDFMGWSTTYTLSYVDGVGYLFAQVRETYPKENDEVNWNGTPTATEVTVYIGKVYTAYSDGTITLGACTCKFDGETPRGGWYNDGFEVSVDSEEGTFEIVSEDAGASGEIG